MRAAWCVALLSGAAYAQELGKEIQPTPPPVDIPAAAPAPGAAPAPSAGGLVKGAFGLTASFQGGTLAGVPAQGAAGGGSPTFGIKYFVTDRLGIIASAGIELISVPNNTLIGFGGAAGVDFHFGAASSPLRPFLTGSVGVAKLVSTVTDDYGLTFAVGGGAEYWFSEHFSLNGRAVVALPFSFAGGNTVFALATLMPGVGANFYF